jgi:hypothetical protein
MRKNPDQQAGAPRQPLTEHREAPFLGNLRAQLSDEEIRSLIAQAAYYRARKRGFVPGYELKDWLEAEAEVMTKLGLWE